MLDKTKKIYLMSNYSSIWHPTIIESKTVTALLGKAVFTDGGSHHFQADELCLGFMLMDGFSYPFPDFQMTVSQFVETFPQS